MIVLRSGVATGDSEASAVSATANTAVNMTDDRTKLGIATEPFINAAREAAVHNMNPTPVSTAGPILDVQRLTKSYPNGTGTLTVLKDISFSLSAGDTCAILGPSGSGKTTLLGLCAGLDQPSEGQVRLDGIDLGTLDEDGRARVRNDLVGFVFQNFQLISTLTALENVMVPLELRGENGASGQAIDLLQRVGLGERLAHYPTQLSGGEQQRVALARAYINRPKILFADEPTGNLDTETGRLVIDSLFALNADAGTALVLVTHDTELARRAQRLIRLKGGMIVNGE
jgi:putative ABC transport system ATP-binding protein